VIAANLRCHLRIRQGDLPRALFVVVALATLVWPVCARADVHALALDGCSESCNPNTQEEPAIARDRVDEKVVLSLCGGDASRRSNGPNHDTFVFDLKGAPTILVSAPLFPVAANIVLSSAVQYIATPFGDFEYVQDFSRRGGEPAGITAKLFFTAAPPLTVGLSEIISEANAYFVTPPLYRR
jgi:hypothetical protein